MTTSTDNATDLVRALDQVHRVVKSVPDAALLSPTPCEDYDVTALVDHLAVVAQRVVNASSPQLQDGDVGPSGVGPRERWANAYQSATDAVRGADPTKLAHLPFGTMPLGAAFAVYVGEFATHAWDLAVALGRGVLLDDEDLAETALRLVTERIPAALRGPTPFGEVVQIPADAAVYDRLAAWMGRDPAMWRTAS